IGVVVHQVQDAHAALQQLLAEAQVIPVVEKRVRAVEHESEIEQEQCRLQRGGGPDELAHREGMQARAHHVYPRFAHAARSAALEFPSSASSEYDSTMRLRAATCIAFAAPASTRVGSMPSTAAANASGSRGATTVPHAPTMRAQSPTSVTTHGRPQAIASAITFGKLSP